MNFFKEKNKKMIQDLMSVAEYSSRIFCSVSETNEFQKLEAEGKPLPDDVISESGAYYRRKEKIEISTEDLKMFIMLSQMNAVQTIKKCVIFFTALTAGSIVISWIVSWIELGF